MQTLGIDCRFASRYAGLGTYTRAIVQALLHRSDPWKTVLFVTKKDESWLRPLTASSGISIIEAPFPHYSIAEQITLPRLVREAGCDLYYAPQFNVPFFVSVPSVCTVHDLILHRYPNQAGLMKRLAYRLIMGRTMKASKAIVAVSNSTAADLVTLYPTAQKRIHVIHPGVDPRFRQATAYAIAAVRAKYRLPERFLVYVGNCKQHKNLPLLLDAFSAAKLSGITLVLVSSGKECDSLILPCDVQRIGDIQDTDMPALLSSAVACVSATTMEGFGLPMVESMACGTPVLATKTGSLPEVCGTHALLVDPTVSDLAEGMRRIVSAPLWREGARLQAAETWARRYDWDSSAAALSAIFRQILAPPHG